MLNVYWLLAARFGDLRLALMRHEDA